MFVDAVTRDVNSNAVKLLCVNENMTPGHSHPHHRDVENAPKYFECMKDHRSIWNILRRTQAPTDAAASLGPMTSIHFNHLCIDRNQKGRN